MNASASPPSSACVPSPWWTSTSTTSTRRASRRSRRSRIAVTTSLKTQKPRPTWAKAWCVPPPRFIATPSASAARDASSVAPVARRERSTSSGDHGSPSPSSSRRSSRPSRTRSTQSASCVRSSSSHGPRAPASPRRPGAARPLPHEPVLREREPVALGERVREDVVGERAHARDRSAARSRPRRGLRVRIARWPGGSRASRRSCSVLRTGARSRGRSRSASPRRGRSSRSPTRASASRSPCATSPTTVDTKLVTACDVRSDDDLDRVFAETAEAFGGGLDLLVHSVAFAAAEDLEGRFTDTPRDRFWLAVDISAYSLVACARAGGAADGVPRAAARS